MSDILFVPNNERQYRTNDFAEAVVLSLVYPIIDVDMTDPDDAWFTIERGEITDEYLERYRNRMLLVEPRELMNKLVELHGRMKEAERSIC